MGLVLLRLLRTAIVLIGLYSTGRVRGEEVVGRVTEIRQWIEPSVARKLHPKVGPWARLVRGHRRGAGVGAAFPEVWVSGIEFAAAVRFDVCSETVRRDPVEIAEVFGGWIARDRAPPGI